MGGARIDRPTVTLGRARRASPCLDAGGAGLSYDTPMDRWTRCAATGSLLALLACGGTAPQPTPEPTPAPTPRPDVLAAVRASGRLRVGVELNAPPMFYADSAGKPSGFEWEVVEAVARHMGVVPQAVGIGWPDLPRALADGHVDAIVAGWIAAPELAVSWSDSYLETGLALAVPRGSPIRSLEALQGKRIVVYPDPSLERWFAQKLPGAKLERVQDGLVDVMLGTGADAVVYDFPYLASELYPQRAKARIVALNLHRFGYAFMLPQGQPSLLDAVNEGVRAVRLTPEYAGWLRTFFRVDEMALDLFDLAAPGPGELERGRQVVAPDWTSLRDIAAKEYGDAARWLEIWHANERRIPFPELVPPRTTLQIP